MLRLVFPSADVADLVLGNGATAALLDDEGNVAFEGHVIADQDVDLGGYISTGLHFVGEGTLGKPAA